MNLYLHNIGRNHRGSSSYLYKAQVVKFDVFLIIIILFLFFSLITNTPEALGRSFPVFDALLYKNKPDLTSSGFRPIRMIYDSEIWSAGESKDYPNREKIITVAKKLEPNSLVCVDIEHWPTVGNSATVAESIEKYRLVLSLIRKHGPPVTLGYYSLVPYREYYRALKVKGQKAYGEWQLENVRLRDIARDVDVVFPELYTFSPFRWEQYAIENINEARKYGKPVYVFLWPMYHDSTFFKGRYISAELWRKQLEICYKYADGIVIWGGWQKRWDEDAPWWKETKQFLEKINRK